MLRVFNQCELQGFKFAILVDDETKLAYEAVWSDELQDWETDFSYEVLSVDSFDVAGELDFEGAERQGYRFGD